MLRPNLCDHSDAYIFVKGTITVSNAAAVDSDANKTYKKVLFTNCDPFMNCTSEINNTQVVNAKDFDVVILMYNLIEYSDNYLKVSQSLWRYCKAIPTVNNNGDIIEFNDANAIDSFNFKVKITGQTGDNVTVANQGASFAITETKHYIPVVTLST